jgi:DNA-binding MarR family transcriptional regulator
MHDEHLVNVLGACSLAVADLVDTRVRDTGGTSASGAAALAVLLQAGPLSATELGRRIGLSQPAAARMVDGLQGAGRVTRRPGAGREVQVQLTRSGRESARQLLRHRSQVVETLLDGLTDREREALASGLGKVLGNVYTQVRSADLICRLCDRNECVRTVPQCPVGAAAGEPADA